MRLSGRAVVVLGALLGILVIAATDRILPAQDQYHTQMRLWLAARATGITAYLVLTVLVALGLILSHPVNQSTWKLSKRLFPWHENLFVFVVSFVLAHIVALVLDPYADVSVIGAFIPGLSGYRTVPVAVGSVALYALLLTGLTARYTKSLPTGWWLKLHRLSLAVFLLSWGHGMLAGTDSDSLRWLYVVSGLVVIAAAAYRYWIAKKRRPTFATSLPDASAAPAPAPVPTAPAPTTPAPAAAALPAQPPATVAHVSTLAPEEPAR
jgi:methionine sulfoxide reductase heme-binding subunit